MLREEGKEKIKESGGGGAGAVHVCIASSHWKPQVAHSDPESAPDAGHGSETGSAAAASHV